MTQFNKRSIGKCVFLTLITFGIYGIYWEYLTVKNTHALQDEDSSCWVEMLCMHFIPFYALYWWFTRGKYVRDTLTKRNLSVSSHETAFVLLALFGFGIVAIAIMQHDFNSIPSVTESPEEKKRSYDGHLLEVKNLHTYFKTRKGIVKAVNDVSYTLDEKRTIGIVGESGSGKSVSAMSILRLLDGNGYISEGEVLFEGRDLTKLTQEEMYEIRGNAISVIFQEPMTSLNPVFSVGKQLSEPFMIHQGMSKEEAWDKALDMLYQVQIPNPEAVIKQYPHQLSGGMRQRVMIAMALACRPKILIADEPTTALDVTIQAQILRLMNDLQRDNGTSIIFITHDLGVINEMADDVVVMYCGQVVEQAPASVIFSNCKQSHPYTEGLMYSIPRIDNIADKLEPIPGVVPHPLALPKGCKFAPRCKYATARCLEEEPKLIEVAPGQKVRCFYPDKEVRCSAEHAKEHEAVVNH